jgi:uncharacterized membrane protein
MADDTYFASDWSPTDMLQRAWTALQPHLVILVGVTVAVAVANFGVSMVFGLIEGIISGIAQALADEQGGDAAMAVALGIRLIVTTGRILITLPLTMLTTGALARMALSAARGQTPDLGAFRHGLSRLLPVLFASILVGMATGIGFIFLIIPGLLIAMVLQFFVFILMDTDLGPIDAIQYSWKLAQAHLVNLTVLWLLLGLGGLIALCGTCGLGLLLFQPLALVCQALVYVHLSGRSQDFLPDPAV